MFEKTESKIATCYQGKGIPGLYRYSQSEFIPKNSFGFSSIPMEQHGYIYIPPRCEANSSFCSLHVAFHGCSTIQSEQKKYFRRSIITPLTK